ncbi:tyrosine decarboxylase-like [Atheta coriaria]|uniref:tyrosine decarboxylase-like n=1 Tax=Dalotia coriaria TaxID=877792 RepID=UPI0031F444ED
MNTEEFRIRGKEMIDYICDYMTNISERRVTPSVEPGYLRKLLPSDAPEESEDWDAIMKDVEEKIMPGVTHWQHPRFHAYFPSGNSYPSILGDMLSDAIGCIGFSWAASPACTELETIVTDWFGKAINLPSEFISSSPLSRGGGVIQSSASECVLVCMLAARNQAINYLKIADEEESVYLPRLVAYCSKESHSCVEKAAMILLVKLRILDVDKDSNLNGETLRAAMEEDEAKGLFPFFVSTTLGSTACCSFDKLREIGPICKSKKSVWLHVDGAYAGNAFICPELRQLMDGIEYADSFNTNPNKWLLVNFDCSCLWVKDRMRLTGALIVDPLYLQHANSDEAIDYRHWGIPLSRRFRSLKLWFVIRKYGIRGLRNYIRNHIMLAKYFAELVAKDDDYEVLNDVKLGLVCFRIIGSDGLNRRLLAFINASGKMHMIPSMVSGKYAIRFCVVAEHASKKNMDDAWMLIKSMAQELMETQAVTPEAVTRPPLTRQKSRRFSFTRQVSREVYTRSLSKTNLHDGATPILIPDDETPDYNDDDDEDYDYCDLKDVNGVFDAELPANIKPNSNFKMLATRSQNTQSS